MFIGQTRSRATRQADKNNNKTGKNQQTKNKHEGSYKRVHFKGTNKMARYEIGNADFADMASTGNAEVLFELGLVYAAGREGEQDMIAAHKWFNLAAYKGYDIAKARREEIAANMSKEQIAQAQREAREWITTH